jgi:hypothetical protein
MEGDKIPLNWINAGLVRQTSRSTNDGNECEATVAQSDFLSEPLLGPAVLRAMAETPLDLRDKPPSKVFSTALVRYRMND